MECERDNDIWKRSSRIGKMQGTGDSVLTLWTSRVLPLIPDSDMKRAINTISGTDHASLRTRHHLSIRPYVAFETCDVPTS